ncbi:MAG: co-chaperone HscB, partial [Janthinobacterium lividum]|nr:co-chaperone HscB [Janthinobacterium lividum]
LMQQMEWREELGEARAGKDADALDVLDRQLRGERKALLEQVAAQLDAYDYANAAQSVRALMFLDKFGEEVRFAYEAMEA